MEKGVSDAFEVVELWVQMLLQTFTRTIMLPFEFLSALFN